MERELVPADDDLRHAEGARLVHDFDVQYHVTQRMLGHVERQTLIELQISDILFGGGLLLL